MEKKKRKKKEDIPKTIIVNKNKHKKWLKRYGFPH